MPFSPARGFNVTEGEGMYAMNIQMQSPTPHLCSAPTDPELREWLDYQSAHGSIFLKAISDAAFCACAPDYVTLRPVLIELHKRYPTS